MIKNMSCDNISNKYRKNNGFTIIELVVVITIIGILSAVVISSYISVTRKANETTLKSDLKNAMEELELDSTVSKSGYPAGIDLINSGKGLTASPSTIYQYNVDEVGDYCLTATTNNAGAFHVSSYDNVVKEGTCPGDFEFGQEGWRQIAAGGEHTCGLTADYEVYCWGGNVEKSLGSGLNDNTYSYPVPVVTSGVLSGKRVKYLSTGYKHTCALTTENLAYCWGNNDHGQLGDGTYIDRNYPVAVDMSGVLSGRKIKSISTKNYLTCVIASDNKPYCWGSNYQGALGNDSMADDSNVPVAVYSSGVLSGKSIKKIETGYQHACVIDYEGLAYCWGDGWYGNLGNGLTTDSRVPVAVNLTGQLSGKTIKSISPGYYHTCAIASDNNAYCWGFNENGELGDNSVTTRINPVAVNTSGVLAGKTIKSIGAHSWHTCALASDNKVYCWGYNVDGELNIGSLGNALVPSAVVYDGDLIGQSTLSLSVGDWVNCMVADDKHSYCWGANSYGGQGTGNYDKTDYPVRTIYP